MIGNLRETTRKNAEQDWLKTNLAQIFGLMQGQRDLQTVSRLIMSELTPTVGAHHGAFFLAESANGTERNGDADETRCGSSRATATRSARASRTASASASRWSARRRSRRSRSW